MRHANHELSAMPCPHRLSDVDLLAPGAAEHWYEAYATPPAEAPALPPPRQWLKPDRDALVPTTYPTIRPRVRGADPYPSPPPH